MKELIRFLCLSVIAIAQGGCVQLPAPKLVDSQEEGAVTIALDDHDYDLAAEAIAQELMMRGLPKGYVVALGPIDARDCKYSVQVRTLQKTLQVIFSREGTLQFTAAADAVSGDTAAAEIYKLIEYNHFTGHPLSVEDMQKFGKLAKINGIMFGRVSSIERRIPRMGQEITYRFVWELADTETGVVKLSHEHKIRKNVR